MRGDVGLFGVHQVRFRDRAGVLVAPGTEVAEQAGTLPRVRTAVLDLNRLYRTDRLMRIRQRLLVGVRVAVLVLVLQERVGVEEGLDLAAQMHATGATLQIQLTLRLLPFHLEVVENLRLISHLVVVDFHIDAYRLILVLQDQIIVGSLLELTPSVELEWRVARLAELGAGLSRAPAQHVG